MTAEERADVQEYNRRRYLPGQIEATTKKLRMLIREAERYGMTELANDAWDQVIHEAQAEAIARGGSIGFGELRRGVDER
jgi:hypothetical protein